ncbi:MAG: YfhO family protein [Clostridia bacterium]|nr:YfhO family protein [Clostridia bacterium]
MSNLENNFPQNEHNSSISAGGEAVIVGENIKGEPTRLGKLFDRAVGFFKSLPNRFVRSLSEKNFYYLSFCIPVVILYITYACMSMFPFGELSILTLDMDGQYVYFFEQLRDIYTGQESLFYTFERSLGGEFLGYFTYYLASPLSWLVVIFPETAITEAIMTMFALKSGLASLTFCIYLNKTRKRNSLGFVMFSVMYALCTYATIYQFNTMWMDALIWLPLIALGIEALVKEGKFKLFTISLAIAICSNYYIGYMLCIFVAFYFIFCILSKSNKENNLINEDRHLLKSFVRIALFSLIAIMMAAAIILSAYYSLSFGKSTYQDSGFDPDLRFDVIQLIAKMFVGSFDTVRSEGTPNIYAGTLMLIMLPLFYLSKKIKPREKIFYTVLALVFVVSFSVNTIDLVWHGFQAPIWFNYRYSFMLCFVLLVMAYRGYEELDEASTSCLGKISAALILLVILVQRLVLLKRYEWMNGGWVMLEVKPEYGVVWLSILFILVYLMLFVLRKHTKKYKLMNILLAVVVFVEAFANSAINWDGELKDGGCASRENYRTYEDKITLASEELYKLDSTFYRSEHTFFRKPNDNLLGNMNGISEFTSTFNAASFKLLERLGYNAQGQTMKYLSGNPVTDSLFGIKYVIGMEKEDTNGELPGFNSVSSLYGSITTKGGFVIYENPYSLPIAYLVDKNMEKVLEEKQFFYGDKSPFATANQLYSSMLGKDVTLFETCKYITIDDNLSYIDYDDKGGVDFRKEPSASVGSFFFKVTASYDGNIYMYLPTPYTTAATLTVDGKTISTNHFQDDNKRIIDLGYYKKGTTVTVNLDFSHYRIYLWDTKDYFVQVNDEELKNATDTLKAGGLKITEFSDTSFVGSVNSSKDGTIFTTIPYDSNWIVYVDGERVDTYMLLDSMMGFDITEGKHDIEIVYVHTQFWTGAAISLVGIALFVAMIFLDKIYRKKLKNKPAPSEGNDEALPMENAEDYGLEPYDEGIENVAQSDEEDVQVEHENETNDEISEDNNDIPS